MQAPKRCTTAQHRGISARAVCATRWRSSANPGALATAAAQTRFFRARTARRPGVHAATGTRGRFRLRCFALPRWRCQRITSKEIGHAPGSAPRNPSLPTFWPGKGGSKQCPVPGRPARARFVGHRVPRPVNRFVNSIAPAPVGWGFKASCRWARRVWSQWFASRWVIPKIAVGLHVRVYAHRYELHGYPC